MRPARQVISRSPHRSVGTIAAPWLQDTPVLEHESETEKSFLQIAVTCPIVRRIQAQPFELSYMLADKAHTAIPDYLITFRSGVSGIVEVKPAKFIPKYWDKFNAISIQLSKRGLTYYVVSNCTPGDWRVAEASLWRRYARTNVEESGIVKALSLTSSGVNMALEDLVAAGIPTATIYHLLGRGQLVSSTGFALTPETRLFAFEQEEPIDEHVYFEHWVGCTPWRENLETRTSP